VVEIGAESLLAKGAVFACIQDEFMPQVVDHPGRHADAGRRCAQVDQEKTAQRAGDEEFVLIRQGWVGFAQAVQ
jgi:hypothetical protein